MNCDWHLELIEGKMFAVSCCGFKLQDKNPKECWAKCRKKNGTTAHRPHDSTLIGNRVEAILKAAKITPGSYIKLKAKLGALPTCGCNRRKEWLNRAHAWLRGETIEPLIDEPR